MNVFNPLTMGLFCALLALAGCEQAGAPAPVAPAIPQRSLPVVQDCPQCPEMVVLPAGTFSFGSPEGERGRDGIEGPVTRIAVPGFAIARTEVTVDQWGACVAAGACTDTAIGGGGRDFGWDRYSNRSRGPSFQNLSQAGGGPVVDGGDSPVAGVSWEDAQDYIAWLNAGVEGAPYRLPSEPEWEYAARAGTTTRFATGDSISPRQANHTGMIPSGGRDLASAYGHKLVSRGGQVMVIPQGTVPVGAMDAANAWGLRHMHGNVWEWVQDCKVLYRDRPAVPGAYQPADSPVCRIRAVRGGGWNNLERRLRSASRDFYGVKKRSGHIGFRPARSVTP